MPTAAGLYYFAHGADELARPAVILIHGVGGSHLSWPPQVRRLLAERVIALDLPGHGKSAGVGHHRIADYTDDLFRFMTELKISGAVLVGHSMGGAIALQAALSSPERVLGLVLVGSAPRLAVNPTLLQMASDPAKASAAIDFIVDHSFGENVPVRLRELAGQRINRERPSILYGDLLACDAFDATAEADRIAVPTLILFGAQDRMVSPARARALHRQIRGSQLEILPTAGHMLMLEEPDRTAELLGDFVRSIPYQPGA